MKLGFSMMGTNWLRSLLTVWCVCLGCSSAAPLPSWESAQQIRPPSEGSLFPNSKATDDSVEQPESESNAPETKKTLPERFKSGLPPITGELRRRYFVAKPMDFVIDPLSLLPEQKANDMHRFLELHAEKADIPIYAIIIGEKQAIPEDVDLSDVLWRWFGDNPLILAVYRLEKPDELELVFSGAQNSEVSAPDWLKVRDSCREEGKRADNAANQIENILVELSIQLFGLENLPAPGVNESLVSLPVLPAPIVEEAEAIAPRNQIAADELPPVDTEVPPMKTTEEVSIENHLAPAPPIQPMDSFLAKKSDPIANPPLSTLPTETLPSFQDDGSAQLEDASASPQSLAAFFAPEIKWIREMEWTPQQIGLIITSTALLLLALIIAVVSAIRRRIENTRPPALFPGYQRLPRLGGEFSGGTIADISFDLEDC